MAPHTQSRDRPRKRQWELRPAPDKDGCQLVMFFMPELDDEAVAERLDAIRQRPGRAIHKMEYERGRSRFEVEVGEPRKEFRRETGPRSGYIRDVDFERLGRDTGGTVVVIVDLGDVIEAYGLPAMGWGVPSLVGHGELTEPPEYFEKFA